MIALAISASASSTARALRAFREFHHRADHIVTRAELVVYFGGSAQSGGVLPSKLCRLVSAFMGTAAGTQFGYVDDGFVPDKSTVTTQALVERTTRTVIRTSCRGAAPRDRHRAPPRVAIETHHLRSAGQPNASLNAAAPRW